MHSTWKSWENRKYVFLFSVTLWTGLFFSFLPHELEKKTKTRRWWSELFRAAITNISQRNYERIEWFWIIITGCGIREIKHLSVCSYIKIFQSDSSSSDVFNSLHNAQVTPVHSSCCVLNLKQDIKLKCQGQTRLKLAHTPTHPDTPQLPPADRKDHGRR